MKTSRDQFDDSVEIQLARLQPRADVGGLRESTLGRVRRELRSSRWDHRLVRVAAVLLVVGIAMNVATIRDRRTLPTGGQLATHPTADSIAELAVTMAEENDVKTANIFGRHLASLKGLPLDSHEVVAIEREIDRRLSTTVSNGKDG